MLRIKITAGVLPELRSQFYVQATGCLGWGVNTDLYLNGPEEFLLSGNCLIISLLGLIMSLEFLWTSVWELWLLGIVYFELGIFEDFELDVENSQL